MTDMQNILAALIAAIKDRRITVDVAEAAVRMLDGVPDYSHLDAIKALLRTPSSDEEHPEDYLAVKTFASNEFHVGDEVIDSEKEKGIVTSKECGTDIYVYVLYSCGTVGTYSPLELTRTGRNFPAIPAILEELKKA